MPDPIIRTALHPFFGHFKNHLLSNRHQIRYTLSSTISEHDLGVFWVIKVGCLSRLQLLGLLLMTVTGQT